MTCYLAVRDLGNACVLRPLSHYPTATFTRNVKIVRNARVSVCM